MPVYINNIRLSIDASDDMAISEAKKRLGAAGNPGRLRVCCFDSVNHYLFRPVYEAFLKRCPNAILEMQDMPNNNSFHSVMRGETDLIFTPSILTNREIKAKTLFTEKMVFLCAKKSDYPEIVELSDLKPEDEVLIEWTSDVTRWHRHIFGEENRFRYSLAETGNLPLFLKQPNCWLLAPASVAQGLLQQPEITTRQTAFSLPQRVTNCLYRESEQNNPLIRVFMDCLNETAERFEKLGLLERI